jgi:hypothetical protein
MFCNVSDYEEQTFTLRETNPRPAFKVKKALEAHIDGRAGADNTEQHGVQPRPALRTSEIALHFDGKGPLVPDSGHGSATASGAVLAAAEGRWR